jgi:two-component system, NarL family, response regulator NreC
VTHLRIVLAEDHEVVRTGLLSLVNATSDMRVVGEARNGEEAVSRARELRPDVIVMDVSMPVMDGVVATERVTAECPGVRVLVLTAHEDRAHLKRLLKAGAAGYVLKRAAVAELVRAIRTVAAGNVYVDPLLAGAILRDSARDDGTPEADAELLSDREEEVLRRLAWGDTNREVATLLGVSTKTVETYKSRITAKLGLRSRTDMVRFAIRQGWLVDE